MTRAEALARLTGRECDRMTVGNQLRSAYKLSGLTLAHIAERAGVSETTLNDAMRDRNVTIGNVVAIAGALGLATLEIPHSTREALVGNGSGRGKVDDAPLSPDKAAFAIDNPGPR